MSAAQGTTPATATAGNAAATPAPAAKGTAKPRAPRAPKAAKASKAVDCKTICDQFAAQVMERYQLDEPVMASMAEVVHAVLSKYHIYSEQQTAPAVAAATVTAGKKGSKASAAAGDASTDAAAAKKPRKSSAYNVYVKEKMQDEQVKAVPQKEKMTMIGGMWKLLSAADRAPYTAQAAALNAAAGLGDDAATENPSEAV